MKDMQDIASLTAATLKEKARADVSLRQDLILIIIKYFSIVVFN